MATEDGSCCTTDGMLTDDGDGMIGVLAVNGVVGVTATAGIGSFIDDFDGICTSFKIKSFTSLLLLDEGERNGTKVFGYGTD